MVEGRVQSPVPLPPRNCVHTPWVLSVYPELAHEVTALLSGWGLEARTMRLPTEKPLVIKRGRCAVNIL